ncbi:MAG: hypothetical protein HY529_02430 [Chloroflexi bacterium]|nr:hypothetical protein [Chloroflexota bacterium]
MLHRANYQVSFNGLHNRSKAKAWLVLLESQLAGNSRGLTTLELSHFTAISRASLASLLIHWKKWEFVLCHRDTGLCHWLLAVRGKEWLLRWYSAMPMLEYERELPVSIERALLWLNSQSQQSTNQWFKSLDAGSDTSYHEPQPIWREPDPFDYNHDELRIDL